MFCFKQARAPYCKSISPFTMGLNGSSYDYIIHVALIATFACSRALLITSFQPPLGQHSLCSRYKLLSRQHINTLLTVQLTCSRKHSEIGQHSLCSRYKLLPRQHISISLFSLVPRHQIFRARTLRPCRKIGSGHVHW